MTPRGARRLASVLGGVGLLLALFAFLVDQNDRGNVPFGETYETPPDTIAAGVVGVVLALLAVAIFIIGAGVSVGTPRSGAAPHERVSVVDELSRLEVLRSNGAITDDEFTRLKSDLIGGSGSHANGEG